MRHAMRRGSRGKPNSFVAGGHLILEITQIDTALQNCMVYINTLMLQQVLAQSHWKDKLSASDRNAMTPLIWDHVTPYGRFDLDMNTRLSLIL